jgi:RNA recognition motif-containing protein
VGKIPKDMFEDELVPLFEKCGTIWDFRLMMEPLTGLNRGYAFVTFTTKEAAQEAVKQVCSCCHVCCWIHFFNFFFAVG